MTRFVTAYEAACPGYTLNYTSSGSGAGVSEFIGGQTDIRRHRFPAERRQGRGGEGQGALRRQPRPGTCRWSSGPIAITYNARRASTAWSWTDPTVAKIFNGTVTTWDAPEIAALNPGKTLPAAADRRDLPQRRVRHHRQLPEVPRRRLRRRLGQGRRQDLQRRRRRRRQGQRGHLGRDQDHPRLDHLQRMVLRQDVRVCPSPRSSPPRARTRSSCPSSRPASRSTASRSRARATTWCSTPRRSTSRPWPARTRSCSPPTRSSARSTRTAEVAPAVKAFLTVALGKGQEGLTDNGYIPVPEAFKGKLSTADRRDLLSITPTRHDDHSLNRPPWARPPSASPRRSGILPPWHQPPPRTGAADRGTAGATGSSARSRSPPGRRSSPRSR